MASNTPYLASIGLLSDEPLPVAEPSALLTSLQEQYGRVVDNVKCAASREVSSKEEELQALEARCSAALERAASERAALEHAHATEMETHRQSTTVALRSLHAELGSLRKLHVQEMDSLRQAADEEHGQLREWCAAQLDSQQRSRDAMVGQLAEQQEHSIVASDSQLAHVVRILSTTECISLCMCM